MSASATYIPIVMDTGTMTLKAGFGGEEAPREALPSLVGAARHPGLTGAMLGAASDLLSGHDAQHHRGLLKLTAPLERGRVKEWAALEQLWYHTLLVRLGAGAEEHPLLLGETPDTSRVDREKAATLLFETLNLPAVATINTSALSLFATGRATGLVVESGAGRTHIGAVWDGYTLPHQLQRIDYGGEDVTRRLTALLRRQGYPFSTSADIDQARALKEALCYVAGDPIFEAALCRESRGAERLYRLPDGHDIYMNDTRFLTPEILISPKTTAALTAEAAGADAGVEALGSGWPAAIRATIEACDPALLPTLYGAVVLGGGNTLFPRLDERIQREVGLLAPRGIVTRCVAFRNRQYAAWIGGSIIGSLSTFPCMWVSKSEYDEHGPSIVHRKFM